MKRPRPLHILAQGAAFIVVAKPPKMLTHRTEFTPNASAALQAVREMVGRSVYPVHRLDRSASGCLLFATEQAATAPLAAAFAQGQKQYLAFVRGHYRATEPVVIDKQMRDDNGILKDARSVVYPIAGSSDPRCSLVRVLPETGRYHQVRRHIRDLHHPIIGDGDHGDGRENRWWRENGDVDRLGLHCWKMEVPWEEPFSVMCPLFVDQYRVFSKLPWWSEALAVHPELAEGPLLMRTPLPGARGEPAGAAAAEEPHDEPDEGDGEAGGEGVGEGEGEE